MSDPMTTASEQHNDRDMLDVRREALSAANRLGLYKDADALIHAAREIEMYLLGKVYVKPTEAN